MDLNQVTLPVKDVDEAIRFYCGMGFHLIVRSLPRYARFECNAGNATFSVHYVERQTSDHGVVIYFECSDLDSKVKQLMSCGYTFDQLPKDEAWLWREARLRDPSNNVLCLYSAGENRRNPPWRVKELG